MSVCLSVCVNINPCESASLCINDAGLFVTLIETIREIIALQIP